MQSEKFSILFKSKNSFSKLDIATMNNNRMTHSVISLRCFCGKRKMVSRRLILWGSITEKAFWYLFDAKKLCFYKTHNIYDSIIVIPMAYPVTHCIIVCARAQGLQIFFSYLSHISKLRIFTQGVNIYLWWNQVRA